MRPPVTTEFAVMFLPSEGLYAEVLRTPGLAERLQRDFRVTPAGPTVLSALLNSLLMGFMTLAMEKRSGEVWRLLSEVKSEFEAFSKQFAVVEKKFREAQNSLEVMGVKRQRMSRRMNEIDGLSELPDGPEVAGVAEGADALGALPMNPVLNLEDLAGLSAAAEVGDALATETVVEEAAEAKPSEGPTQPN